MTNELQFKQEYGLLFVALRELEVQKKKIESKEKEAREELRKAMEKHNIKEVDTSVIKATWIAPVEASKKLDEKAWRAADPEGYNEVFEKYNKMGGAKKSSVRITPK